MARHRALTAACPAMYERFCVWPKRSCWSGTAAILWPNPAHFSSRWHGRISFWGGDLSSHPNVALVPTVLCAKKCLTAPLKGAARTLWAASTARATRPLSFGVGSVLPRVKQIPKTSKQSVTWGDMSGCCSMEFCLVWFLQKNCVFRRFSDIPNCAACRRHWVQVWNRSFTSVVAKLLSSKYSTWVSRGCSCCMMSHGIWSMTFNAHGAKLSPCGMLLFTATTSRRLHPAHCKTRFWLPQMEATTEANHWGNPFLVRMVKTLSGRTLWKAWLKSKDAITWPLEFASAKVTTAAAASRFLRDPHWCSDSWVRYQSKASRPCNLALM